MDAFLHYASAGKPSSQARENSVSFPARIGTPAAAAALGQVSHLLIEPENVLYDATLWPRWLWQVLSHMGVKAPYREFFAPWHDQFRKEVDLGRRDSWDVFQEFLAHAGLSQGQIAEVLAAGVCRKKRFESERRCLPGVSETLRRLASRGVSLYVLANTPRFPKDVLHELESMGLQGVFDGALTSRELQCVTPAAKCYRKALNQFGLEASQTAFVASRPRLLRGAARCGMQAIGFNEERPTRAAVSLEWFSDLALWIQPPLPAKAAG